MYFQSWRSFETEQIQSFNHKQAVTSWFGVLFDERYAYTVRRELPSARTTRARRGSTRRSSRSCRYFAAAPTSHKLQRATLWRSNILVSSAPPRAGPRGAADAQAVRHRQRRRVGRVGALACAECRRGRQRAGAPLVAELHALGQVSYPQMSYTRYPPQPNFKWLQAEALTLRVFSISIGTHACIENVRREFCSLTQFKGSQLTNRHFQNSKTRIQHILNCTLRIWNTTIV